MFQRAQFMLVFRYRQFLLFFIGNLVSWVGNSMQAIANSWLALVLTGTPASVAYVLIANALPGVLFSPFIGVMIDRSDRRLVLVLTDILRAVLLIGLFLLGIRGLLQPWHLYAMSFLLALGDVIYRPGATAFLREEIPQDVLMYTNSYDGIARQAGGIAGAALAGILIFIFSPYVVLCLNSISYIFAALCLFFTRKGYKSPVQPGRAEKQSGLFVKDLVDGLSYIKSSFNVVILYALLLLILSTLDIINVAIVAFVTRELHSNVVVMSYMEAAFAIGSVLGNIFIPGIATSKGANRTMTIGVWSVVLVLLILALSPNPPIAILSYLFLGATIPTWTLYLTAVQKIVPDHYQGRVFSTFFTVGSIVSLVLFFGLSYLVGVVSVRSIYFLQAALLIIAGVLAYRYVYLKKVGDNPGTEETLQMESVLEGEKVSASE